MSQSATYALSNFIPEDVEPEKSAMLVVSEIFGPTIQGEGPHAGTPCMFLRLAVCNLACTWCDTRYSWDFKQFNYKEVTKRMTAIEIVDKIKERGVNHLVISGGEPLLQQEKLRDVIDMMPAGYRIEIETAGTIIPNMTLMNHCEFNVSVKLQNSGNPTHKRIVPKAIQYFVTVSPNTRFKFVVSDPTDFREIDELVADYGICSEQMYIMMIGISSVIISSRAERMMPMIIERGWKYSPRLQVDIWGGDKGH